MSKLEINLSNITQIKYNTNPLSDLVLENQTIWTRPPFSAGGNYVREYNILHTKGAANLDSSLLPIDDSTGLVSSTSSENTFGSVGTTNHMSQDGSIISYNFRDRIIIMRRNNPTSNNWSLRGIIAYGPAEALDSKEKAFAMNHDGSYIVTGINGTLKVWRWDGSNYSVVQQLSGYSPNYPRGPYDEGHFLSIRFSQTLNAFVSSIDNRSAPIMVFGEFSGKFYALGEPIEKTDTRSDAWVSICDGGIENTSPTYENINVAWSIGYSFYQSKVYYVTLKVNRLQNNKWVEKGTLYEGRSINSYTNIQSLILSQDGNSIMTYIMYGELNNVSGDGGLLRTHYLDTDQVYSNAREIKRIFNSRLYGLAASNDLKQVFALNGQAILADYAPTRISYSLTTAIRQGSGLAYTTSTSAPREWRYKQGGYNIYGTNTAKNVTYASQLHGGVSCSETGELCSFNYVVEKAINGNSYKVEIIKDTPEYQLNASVATLFESNSTIITLSTIGVPNTSVPYTITGIQAADIQEPLTGSFEVVDSVATVTLNAVADSITEGTQTLKLSLDNGEASIDVDIIDTSV